LLHGAEAIGLKKEYKDGSIREFCFTDRYNFTNQEDDDFLLESEKHQIIKVELDSLRALDEKYVPGHQSIKLYPGKSIFRRLASNELITDFFPLHDRPALHKLRWAWYKTIDLNLRQPLENHRLESDFQKNLITKILVFDFANNFLALFYIAFIYDDMPMLRQTLRNLFLVHMIVSQALESLLPYWTFRYRSSLYRATLKSNRKAELTMHEQTCLELQRDTYWGTFDDYLELWLQFGYVVLFSCVYPPAAIFALINNVIEMKSDAFKMCNVYRRPFVYQTNGIGTWKVAFEALSYLAVVSNLALIFHTSRFIEGIYKVFPDASTINIILAFVAVEHILLGVRWLISYAVPVVPHWVKVETQRMKYFSLQALKRQ
uniref:Anoctamin n=1 Tax=Ciona savignyi TaxID=51511 RepID=H2YH05_CIOSA